MIDKKTPQPDRPRWVTPMRARKVEATAGYLDSLPLGAVLAVPVRFGDENAAVTVSVTKVSHGKYGVHQRRGFPARLLIGARVARRVRRDAVVLTGSEVTA